MKKKKIIIPPKFKELWKRGNRYKIFYGGRAGLKSWQVAIYIIQRAVTGKVFVLCAREIQKSIKDSVYKLLCDQIERLELREYFNIKSTEIESFCGSVIVFDGLRNSNSVKSMEGVDILWVEEAEKISEKSWTDIIPTVRKKGSEVIITFNPDMETDPTYQRCLVEKRKSSVVVKTTYHDNPWFGEPLKSEMEYDRENNYSKYLHIWEGEPVTEVKNLIYRFNSTLNINNKVKYLASHPVYCSWDFGVSDDTAIIFYQIMSTPKSTEFPMGFAIHIFDEIIGNNQDPIYYRQEVEKKGYDIECHYCDPAGANRESDLSSWVDKLSYNPVSGYKDWQFVYTHKYSRTERIGNANEYVPYIRINSETAPKTTDMFKRWSYRTDRTGTVVLPPTPLHDKYSHLGTSLYYFFINHFPPKKRDTGVYVY